MIFETLKSKGVVPIAVQTPVVDAKLGIRTRLDGVGWDKANRSLVVLELKTTRYTRSVHSSRYEARCRNCPRLANGLGNCEKVVHGIQAGFGVMCLRRALPQYRVTGAVIVACSNAAVWYDVPTALSRPAVFDVAKVQINRSSSSQSPKFLEWPLDPATFTSHLRRLGVHKVEKDTSGRASAIGYRRDGTPVLIGLGHCYQGYTKSSTYRRQLEVLKKRSAGPAILVWYDRVTRRVVAKKI